MPFTDEALSKMSADRLLTLYGNAKHIAKNATDKRSVEAVALVEQIERLQLHYQKVEGLKNDDPVLLKIHEIVHSDAGVAGIVDAVERGLPGLAGVEQLIVKELGEFYSGKNTGTQAAGEFVGQVMGGKGYVRLTQGAMPEGSVAKTAMRYRKRT